MGYPHKSHPRETPVLSKHFGDPEARTLDGWKARGGYGSQRDDGTVNENRHRERLWLSPHCEGARQLSRLGGGA
jgi:hypothetical protein